MGRRDPFIGELVPSSLQPRVSYLIEARLGEGGTALAYLARRRAPDGEALVVIKIILPQLVADSDEQALTIIKKEAVALGRLNERIPPTPNVVRLIDTGSLPFQWHARTIELPWVALEYVHGGVEGSSLEKRVNYSVRHTGFAFDPNRVARALESLASGLSEIHAAGIVHRDIHPGNVLCCGAGETELYKISDFGIARPAGLTATFGNAVVGTPGYAAPEQFMSKLALGPHTDVFSLACVIFFMLTGESLFEINSPAMAVVAVQASERRSVTSSPTLAFELRERTAVTAAIDLVLARATSLSPKERPPSARQLADSLLPWLRGDAGMKPSERWVGSLEELHAKDLVLEATWMVRHPPGEDRVVTDVAWNAGGQALAATTSGLEFWDGSSWADVTASGAAEVGGVRFVERLGPTRWLVGTRDGQLCELSHEGLREILRHPDPELTLAHAAPDFDDVAVFVGEAPEGPPLVLTQIGRRWLKPLPAVDAAFLTGLARLDDERWLVIGRGKDDRSYAAIVKPLAWELERVATPPGRVLLACASRPERRVAVAVGVEGAILSLEGDDVRATTLPGAPDLATVGLDPLGRSWAAGRGRVWSRRSGGEWSCVWEHPGWEPPFVGIMVEVGSVIAMTVDGAVLECRATPAGRPSFTPV
jgi:eukaryotic-like serine/threonine-protein kinase